MTQPTLHVAALVASGDEFLMLRESTVWRLPTGAAQLGETMAEAIVRVVYEEVGSADAVCGPFIGWSEVLENSAPVSHCVTMYFRAVLLQDQFEASRKSGEVRWIPSWETAELGLADGLAEFLSDHGFIDTVV